MNDIFKPVVEKAKLNEMFHLLNEFKPMSAAKEMINQIAKEFGDKDGNFIQQFQTTGFDARMWELFLFKVFQERGFEIIDKYGRPDFYLSNGDTDFFVEASISSEKESDRYSRDFIKKALKENNLEVQRELIDYYVIRMGSILFSKVNKEYWKLDWVKDKPLVIAISPFHNYLAKFLPDAKLIEYLYGIRFETKLTKNGLFIKDIKKVEKHDFFTKEIPSNFFGQKNVENISAILFTNNADLHKFNRMGYQEGLTDEKIMMHRCGFMYNQSPNSEAKEFSYSVKPGEALETWSESITVFHNPNAVNKLSADIFKDLRQVWLNEEGRIDGNETPENFVYHSITAAGIVG